MILNEPQQGSKLDWDTRECGLKCNRTSIISLMSGIICWIPKGHVYSIQSTAYWYPSLFSSANTCTQTTEAAWSCEFSHYSCFIEWWRHYWKVVATVHPFRITVGLFIPVHSAASTRLSRCVSYWSSPRGGTVRQPPPRAPLSPIRCSYDAGDLRRNGPVPERHSAMTVWSLTNTVSRPRTRRSFTHGMLRLDQTAPWRSETGLGKLL